MACLSADFPFITVLPGVIERERTWNTDLRLCAEEKKKGSRSLMRVCVVKSLCVMRAENEKEAAIALR